MSPKLVARAAAEDSQLLVIAEHISPRTSHVLRNAGISYADASGNASLEFGDVLIEIRGRPRASQPPRESPPTSVAGNLFSSARSQVICSLLAWPHLWHATNLDLSRCAGVSVGLAHEARSQLREQGHDEHNALKDPQLLDLWAASFPTGLGRRLHLRDLSGDPGRAPAAIADDRLLIGGESAVADLIRPTTLTVYVDEVTPALIAANRWRTDGPPNVIIRRAFWTEPADADAERDPAIAPWPLVYADLFTSDDPRLRGLADGWRARFV